MGELVRREVRSGLTTALKCVLDTAFWLLRCEVKYFSVILTGWKEISKHLRYGVRTLQRWEGTGLPVRRVNDSPRSPVVANAEELDAWILRRKQPPPGAPADLLKNHQRALELQRVVEENKKEFQIRVRILRKQIEEFQAKRRTQTKRTSGVR